MKIMSVTVENDGGGQDSENLAGNKDCSRYELLNTFIDFGTNICESNTEYSHGDQ